MNIESIITLILTMLLISAASAQRVETTSLLIENVKIVSPHNEFDHSTHTVLIENGTIKRITIDKAELNIASAIVIDANNRYLVPGLIDSHTHLDEIPGMTFQHEKAFPEIAREARRQIPRSYLYHGFTTVIDLNSSPDAIERWNSQNITPTAYFCGAAPIFDGYPMSFMPIPERYQIMPYFLFDESRAESFPKQFEPRDHSPIFIANKIKNDGGVCIKTHHEKGFGGHGDLPLPELNLIKDLVSQAKKVNLPVLLHANSEASQKFGIKSGVSAFAHGMWTWTDQTTTSINTDIRQIIDASISKDIALQPTIQVLYGEQDLHDPNYLADVRLTKVLPKSLIDWYGTETGQWWKNRMLRIPFVAKLVKEGRWQELDEPPIRRVTSVVSYFANNGGLLLFGSDTPSDPTFANPPGLNGRLEMDRWMDAGVSLPQLFKALTINNATFFGLYEKIGSVEEGKQANLLILRENPLENITAYDSIETVIINGRVLERSKLAAN